MHFEKTIIENCCQHARLEHTWTPGLNGVLGANGSGKSNLLKLIEAAFTNDFTTNAGPKAENIRAGIDKGARAFVEHHFELGGIHYRLIRGLQRVTTQLISDGKVLVSGDTPVTNMLDSLIGVSPKMRSEAVFIKQKKMAAFLDDTDTTRAAFYSRLFDTQKIAAINELLTKTLAATRLPERSGALDELARKIVATENLILRIQDRIGGLGDGEVVDDARMLVARAGSAQTIATNAARAQDRWRATVVAHRQAVGRARDLARDVNDCQALVDAGAADAAAASAGLMVYAAIQTAQQTRTRCENQLAALEREPAAHPAPTPPTEELPDAASLQDAGVMVHRAERLLKTFDPSQQLAECPTCHTPGVQISAYVEETRAVFPELKALHQALAFAEQAWVAYNQRLREWQIWRAGYDKRLAEAKENLRLLGDGPALPAQSMADLQACVVAHSADKTALRKAKEVADQHARVLTAAASARRQAGDQLRQLLPRDFTVITQAEFTAAIEKIRRADQHAARIGALRGRVAALQSQLSADRITLGRLQKEAATLEARRNWIALLEQAKALTHATRWPRVVAAYHMGDIVAEINALLEEFGVLFRVSVDENLAFVADFLDGGSRRATRLSEGQKVLLSMGFRVAVNSRFASELGVLVLDEPSDSLDSANTACLEIALNRMRSLSASRGLQCLIVTHVPRLASLCHSVLNLDTHHEISYTTTAASGASAT